MKSQVALFTSPSLGVNMGTGFSSAPFLKEHTYFQLTPCSLARPHLPKSFWPFNSTFWENYISDTQAENLFSVKCFVKIFRSKLKLKILPTGIQRSILNRVKLVLFLFKADLWISHVQELLGAS